jgi:hypothetical protein
MMKVMKEIMKKVNNRKSWYLFFYLLSICWIGYDEEQGTTGNDQNNRQSTSGHNQPVPQRETNQS